jgi:hypothetical protein
VSSVPDQAGIVKYRIYLNVSFGEKDIAKGLGAKWDPVHRKWYVPEGFDSDPFKAWFPVLDEDGQTWISTPLFVAESSSLCWSCKEGPIPPLPAGITMPPVCS